VFGEEMIIDAFSVLIPDGEDPLSLLVARCLAKVPNVKLYILSSKQWALGRFTRHHCSYEFRPMSSNTGERIQTLVDAIKKHNVDVILPVSERGAEFVAANHRALADAVAVPPIPGLAALSTATNKWSLAQFASEQSLPIPASLLVTLDDDFYGRLSTLEYPVVLKPHLGAGGKGIKTFRTPSDLQTYLRSQDGEQIKNKYLLQSYVPGFDLGLSVLYHESQLLAFTVQQGLMTDYPGQLKAMKFVTREDALEVGHKLLSALNWSGVAHVDMRHDSRNGQVKVLEVNGRYWGSLIGSLVAGVNFPYLACLTALGVPFPMPTYRLSKFTHTQTAAKEYLRRLLGKDELGEFSFGETGWIFFLDDPLPELMNAAAKFGQHRHVRRFIPGRLLNFFNEVTS
jgi:predicted ATP-grasp superfamily ATP-dependent carboligase